MRSQVLITRTRNGLLSSEPTMTGRGARGWPIIADLFLIVGVALAACLLGLAIGATLSNVAFSPGARDVAGPTAHPAAQEETVGTAAGEPPAPPLAR